MILDTETFRILQSLLTTLMKEVRFWISGQNQSYYLNAKPEIQIWN